MNFHLSKHVQEEMEKRKISRTLLDGVLQTPEQKVPEAENVTFFNRESISTGNFICYV